LRALRAVRFSVKLGFRMAPDLRDALHNPVLPELMAVVSTDGVRPTGSHRVREDLAGLVGAARDVVDADGEGVNYSRFNNSSYSSCGPIQNQ
jgi:hypothetical protein